VAAGNSNGISIVASLTDYGNTQAGRQGTSTKGDFTTLSFTPMKQWGPSRVRVTEAGREQPPLNLPCLASAGRSITDTFLLRYKER